MSKEKNKQWKASDIKSLDDLRLYQKDRELKYLLGHSVWKETGAVQENVQIMLTVVYDKKYAQDALKWYLKGDRRSGALKDNYVNKADIEFEADGKFLFIQLYKVGLRIRVTII